MDSIKEELIKVIKIFKEEYRFSSGIPRIAIGYYSFDPINSAELNYTADKYYGRTRLHAWKDLGILVKELNYLFKSMLKNNPVFYTREVLNESSIITIFNSIEGTYERFFIENEDDFYKRKSEKYEVTHETSEDPIFETLINFYEFQPKN